MGDLKTIVTKLVDSLKEDINEYYRLYESYLTDLILSKNINISLIIDLDDQKDRKNNILSIIATTNSALITIGISKSKLAGDLELYQELFEKNTSVFNNYLSFLQLGLKDYINKHLFIIVLDYMIDNNNNIIENLDLFDLLPPEFRMKLTKFRNELEISGTIKNHFKIFNDDLLKYFNPSNLTFKVEDFQIENHMETISEDDILRKLEEARRGNIEALNHSLNQKGDKVLL
ncbi:MAG: hypothetical protein ACTSO8_02395, partial [Promethearchaeota archaeon]